MLTAPTQPGAKLAAKCPSCGHLEATDILTISDAPVMVATVFPDADTARTTPSGTIRLACCTRCGLLFNTEFDLAKALAGARYESSQASSAHFSAYSQALAKEWVERHGLRGQRVIEVGCGQGDFMTTLLHAGVGSVLGIDPLARESDFPAEFADRVSIDASDFLERHVDTAGAALVCRHTIEHVPDVAGFMRLVAAWSRHNDAPVLFEAPAAERIVEDGAFWDLYYEHCNYFTHASLEIAFREAGLRVSHHALTYGDQYLLVDAQHDPGPADDVVRQPGWQEASARFGARANDAVVACRTRMKEYGASPGGLVIWQGAAKTVGLLTSLGKDVAIEFAVDLNPRRHGYFLPPLGLQVLPPEALASVSPGHVVLMNPVYMTEVRKQLDGLGRQSTVLHSIDSVIAKL
ncbi:MAG TPA: class I SAM-dependent methyltransferase [Polyangiaceae bacterium]|nr:class I SAM-dependent methyltransferase [Polyangiaceae bacterium]